MRTYVDPLLATDVSHARELIGQNSGNLIFSMSAQRLVSAPGVDVSTTHFNQLIHQAARVNEEQRHVVIPLANSFRPSFIAQLRRLTNFIKKLTVPVTILGVGAQGSADYDIDVNSELDAVVRGFVSAVLDHGPTIGVRGQFTADYLASLGFSDVTVIGCPSMFLRGPDLTIRDQPFALTGNWPRDSKVAINLTPSVSMPAGWTRALVEQNRRIQYIPQGLSDLDLILGGKSIHGANPEYPGQQDHPLMADDRAVFYLHAPTWVDAMAMRDFVVGHRIHGNVAGLLGGTPAHVIAHDSRTRELADYFQIPHTLATAITGDTTLQELYERSSWRPVVEGHAERVGRLADYLDSHGLAHTARTGWGDAPLEQELAQLDLWGPEVTITPRSQDPASLDARIANTNSTLRAQIDQLERRTKKLAGQVDTMKSPKPRTLATPDIRKLRRFIRRP